MTSTAGTFYAPVALLQALAEPIHPAAGSGGFLLQRLPLPVELRNPPFSVRD